jgi:hypothetical protein
MPADPLIASIGVAIKDLLKFKIIQQIATGDKTYDSLLQTLFLSIITAMFGMISYDYVKTRVMLWKVDGKGTAKGGPTLDVTTYQHWVTESAARVDRMIYVSWSLNDSDASKAFTRKVCTYFNKKVGWKLGKSRATLLDPVTMEGVGSLTGSAFSAMKATFKKSSEYTPLFVLDDHVAGMTENEGSILLYADSDIAMKAMLKEINTTELDEATVAREEAAKKGRDLSIYYKGEDTEYALYRDRSLDKFVSRHKPKILALLENFVRANKATSDFNGFGTYNLGFMLHGRPGTGKTHLIKAICNYLGRSAYMIDMRKIKNRKDFEGIFLDEGKIKANVLVLDEFDCVQGAIRDRSLDSADHKSPLEDLHARQMELLKLMMLERPIVIDESKGTKETKESKKNPIQVELDKIEKVMADGENALTLDTMLEVLDGVIEVRGRVIIAATNYIDNIDKALMRDGRFDIKVKLDVFNADETRELLRLMFANKRHQALNLQDWRQKK